MGFTAPAGLWALLAIPLVLVLHLFRRRFRERRVAGLFLFAADALPADAGRTRARLLRTPSLWLELLAALLLALWLGGLHVGAPSADHHLVLVLDDSASMGAVGPNGALVDAARDHVTRRLDDLDDDARVTILTTGARPELQVGPRGTLGQARRALEAWAPRRAAHDPSAAWELGLDLAGRDGELLYVTDRDDTPPPPRYRHLAVGTPLANAAIVSARRIPREDGERVFADLLAFSGGPVPTTVELHAVTDEGEREIVRKQVTLEPGRTLHLAWTVPAGRVPLRVRLGEDALAVDNTALLLPEPDRTVPVHVALDEETAAHLRIARVFEAIAGARVVADPAAARLFIGTRWGSAPPGSVALLVSAPGVERDAWIGPFQQERRRVLGGREGRPVLGGVSFQGVVWSAGRGSLRGLPLVAAGAQTLLAEDARGGVTRLHLNLDPAASNLAASPDWPILLTNIVEHVRGELPGPRQVNVRVGAEIVLRFAGTPDEAATHVLFDPHQGARPARGWRTLSWEARHMGIYRLVRGEREVARYAASFVDPIESDLRELSALDAAPTEEASPAVARLGARGHLEGRLIALLLLLVMALDWWVLGRRR